MESESSKKIELYQKSVLADVKAIDKILSSLLLACGIICVLKFIDIPEFTLVADIKLSTDLAWIVVFGLTVGHAFYAGRLAHSLVNLVNIVTYEEQIHVFHMIRTSDSLFIKGLSPRFRVGRFRRMSFKDPSTWVSVFAAIVILFGVVPFRLEKLDHFILLWVAGIISVLGNWVIGSYWVGLISDLTLNPEEFKRTWLVSLYKVQIGPEIPFDGDLKAAVTPFSIVSMILLFYALILFNKTIAGL